MQAPTGSAPASARPTSAPIRPPSSRPLVVPLAPEPKPKPKPEPRPTPEPAVAPEDASEPEGPDAGLATAHRRMHVWAAVLFAAGVLIGFYGLMLADDAKLLGFLGPGQGPSAPANPKVTPAPKPGKTPPAPPA